MHLENLEFWKNALKAKLLSPYVHIYYKFGCLECKVQITNWKIIILACVRFVLKSPCEKNMRIKKINSILHNSCTKQTD